VSGPRARLVPCLLAAGSGLLFAAALPGFGVRPLAWVCLTPLALALAHEGVGAVQAAALGLVAGLVTNLVVASCLVGTLTRFGSLPTAWALLGWLLLAAAQAGLLAGAAALAWVAHASAQVPRWLALPAALVVAEALYPSVFPLYAGNTLAGATTLVQILDVTGPVGLSFLVGLTSATLAEMLLWLGPRVGPPPWRTALGVAVVLALVACYGALRLRQLDAAVATAERRLRVGLVQTNEGIFADVDAVRAGVRRHQAQSVGLAARGVELVVWPESAYNFPLTAGMKDVAVAVLGPVHLPVLFGGLRLDASGERRRVFHSAFLADGDGRVLGYYDKRRLVPFGEYVPFDELWPALGELSPRSGGFSAGQGAPVLLELAGARLAVDICYEDLFPGLLRSRGDGEPHLLVNLTNDAWFGDPREAVMHRHAASFRAVEQRRFLVRATNTGVSAVVNPAGRIVAALPTGAAGELVYDVALLTGTTWYGRFGDAPFVALVGVVALVAGLRSRRERRRVRVASA